MAGSGLRTGGVVERVFGCINIYLPCRKYPVDIEGCREE